MKRVIIELVTMLLGLVAFGCVGFMSYTLGRNSKESVAEMPTSEYLEVVDVEPSADISDDNDTGDLDIQDESTENREQDSLYALMQDTMSNPDRFSDDDVGTSNTIDAGAEYEGPGEAPFFLHGYTMTDMNTDKLCVTDYSYLDLSMFQNDATKNVVGQLFDKVGSTDYLIVEQGIEKLDGNDVFTYTLTFDKNALYTIYNYHEWAFATKSEAFTYDELMRYYEIQKQREEQQPLT